MNCNCHFVPHTDCYAAFIALHIIEQNLFGAEHVFTHQNMAFKHTNTVVCCFCPYLIA